MVLDESDWAFAVLIEHKHSANTSMEHWQDASATQFTPAEMGVDASRLIMQSPPILK